LVATARAAMPDVNASARAPPSRAAHCMGTAAYNARECRCFK
jgi:hypothetical protein